MELTGEYEVRLKGKPAGRLTVKRQGYRTIFTFKSDMVPEVSRLICAGDGSVVSIGIPVPDGNGMYLKRSFSDDALASMGLERIGSCLLIPADADIAAYTTEKERPDPVPDEAPATAEEVAETTHNFAEDANAKSRETAIIPSDVPGWSVEPDPARYFSSRELKSACAGARGVLMSRDGSATFLAFPWSTDEPFPLLPAFRSGSAVTLGGRQYIIYNVGSVERDAQPTVSENDKIFQKNAKNPLQNENI